MPSRIRTVVPAAAAALVLAFAAVPAGSDEHDTEDAEPTVESVTGYAAGGWFYDTYSETGDVGYSYEGIAGPAPQVDLPPEGGGPLTDSLDELIAVFTESPGPGWEWTYAEGLEVSTEGTTGPDGHVASSASVDEGWDSDMIWFAGLEVECSADLANGATGSTTIAEGEAWDYLASSSVEFPTNPAPNTVLFEGTVVDSGDGWTETITARVVLNEQWTDGDTIAVTGVSAYVLVEYEQDDGYSYSWENATAYGVAVCGVNTPDVPVPPGPPAPPGAAAPAQVTPRFTG